MRVVGIHPVVAREPVHLIEIEVTSGELPVEWEAITQPIKGRDESYWQVPYDERELPGPDGRWCFFFHYLDQSQPLSSSSGKLALPPETPVPDRLRFIGYEEP
jgi:hypothetical protein